VKVSAVKVSNLTSLLDTTFVQQADVICVDEGQFFTDIGDFIYALEKTPKIVIVAALDGDMNRKPWRNITDLVCMADDVTKLSANERLMSGEIVVANFSMLLNVSEKCEGGIKIGAADMYKAVSRQTYLKQMENTCAQH